MSDAEPASPSFLSEAVEEFPSPMSLASPPPAAADATTSTVTAAEKLTPAEKRIPRVKLLLRYPIVPQQSVEQQAAAEFANTALGDAAELRAQCTDLHEQLKGTRSELNSARVKAAEQRRMREAELRKSKRDYREYCLKVGGSLSGFSSTIDDLRRSSGDAFRHLQGKRTMRHKLEGLLKNSQDEVAALRTSLADCDTKLKGAKKLIVALQQQLMQATNQLSQATNRSAAEVKAYREAAGRAKEEAALRRNVEAEKAAEAVRKATLQRALDQSCSKTDELETTPCSPRP
eukprot:5134173-Pleurochrysis_carterae.AAC.1